jgi:hypothetical protein
MLFVHVHLHIVPSFVEKHPKIKYVIFDRPHDMKMDLCETSFKLLNGRSLTHDERLWVRFPSLPCSACNPEVLRMRHKTEVPCTWCLCQWQAKDPIHMHGDWSMKKWEIRSRPKGPIQAPAQFILGTNGYSQWCVYYALPTSPVVSLHTFPEPDPSSFMIYGRAILFKKSRE